MTEKKELPWVKAEMEERGCQDVLKGHLNYPFQEGLILGRFIPESEAQRLAELDEELSAYKQEHLGCVAKCIELDRQNAKLREAARVIYDKMVTGKYISGDEIVAFKEVLNDCKTHSENDPSK